VDSFDICRELRRSRLEHFHKKSILLVGVAQIKDFVVPYRKHRSRWEANQVGFQWKDYFWRVWEENRSLTLKVAHTFPDEHMLTSMPVPNMRPFARMLLEIAGLEHFFIRGLAEGIWEWIPDESTHPAIVDVKELYDILDRTRNYTQMMWPTMTEDLLLTPHPAPSTFAGPAAPPIEWLQYAMENEIHHRAQGYTYLRHLGIEPPAFWDRS